MKPFEIGGYERERIVAAIMAGEERELAALPWYRPRSDVLRVRNGLTAERHDLREALERLTRIAGKLEIPQWLVEEAAVILEMARPDGGRLEALERLAFALEQLEARPARHKFDLGADAGTAAGLRFNAGQ